MGGDAKIKNRQRDVMTLIENVRVGRLSRREAIVRLLGIGLSAAGLSATLAAIDLQPARAAAGVRGTGGILRILYWQARPF